MTLHVGLDPGHGGSDPGATDVEGRQEKHFTLSLATLCWSLLLYRGHRVTMTRTGDEYVRPVSRAMRLNNAGVDLVLSIHWNASTHGRPNGTQAYYHRTSPEGHRFAELLVEHVGPLDGDTCEPWERTFAVPDPAYRNGFVHAVIGHTRAPAALLEVEFASNPEAAERMASDPYRLYVAQAVATAVGEWEAERREAA